MKPTVNTSKKTKQTELSDATSFAEACEYLEKVRLDLKKAVTEYVAEKPENFDRKMLKQIYELSEQMRLLYLDMAQEHFARKQTDLIIYRI